MAAVLLFAAAADPRQLFQVGEAARAGARAVAEPGRLPAARAFRWTPTVLFSKL